MGSQQAAHTMQNNLLFDDLQDLHGAGLDADAAGDALGDGCAFLLGHDLEGAGFLALAATNAELLVDHVHAGLGILGNSLMLADLHALAALNADIGLGSVALGNDLDAGQVGIKLLVESLGASLDTLQASHTFRIFLNNELLHKRTLLCIFLLHFHYTCVSIKKQ